VDKTGLLSVATIKSALQARGEEELCVILQEIASADGTVRYTDFLAAAINYQKVLDDNTLYLAFKRFDRDDDGFLTLEEMHSAMINMGSRISQEELKTLLLPFDEDADQVISFQEFKAIFKETK